MTRNRAPSITLVLSFALLAACATQTGKNTTAPRLKPVEETNDQNLSPTAIALQDLGGRVLLYIATHGGRLPAQIVDLRQTGESDNAFLTDPASRKPFVYTPDGPSDPRYRGRLIAHEPAPSSDGFIWVLSLESDAQSGHYVTHVVRVRVEMDRK